MQRSSASSHVERAAPSTYELPMEPGPLDVTAELRAPGHGSVSPRAGGSLGLWPLYQLSMQRSSPTGMRGYACFRFVRACSQSASSRDMTSHPGYGRSPAKRMCMGHVPIVALQAFALARSAPAGLQKFFEAFEFFVCCLFAHVADQLIACIFLKPFSGCDENRMWPNCLPHGPLHK